MFRIMNDKIVTLDVREDLRNGREPFSKIMSTVAALRVDEQLRLIVPFEPVPLFDVMMRRGFVHDAWPIESGDWEVLFTRDTRDLPANDGRPEAPRPNESLAREPVLRSSELAMETMEVDARGLEPPEPLVVILEAAAALPSGAKLCARTDRRPIHLYSRLEEHGFIAETTEQPDGTFLTHIQRR
jgi:uncharacterized protein (DUF2249 family)